MAAFKGYKGTDTARRTAARQGTTAPISRGRPSKSSGVKRNVIRKPKSTITRQPNIKKRM